MCLQVVDNSSAFRMTEGVPLCIPEVNPQALEHISLGKGGIVANPNCSTIIALMAATPLHRAATVKRMVVSTYQVRRVKQAAISPDSKPSTCLEMHNIVVSPNCSTIIALMAANPLHQAATMKRMVVSTYQV